LWTVQARAIRNLEQSFGHADPRALIQMATGSGKTFTAVNVAYRLLKFANAKRVCFSWTAAISGIRPKTSSPISSRPTIHASSRRSTPSSGSN
jgi:hypothetical protein